MSMLRTQRTQLRSSASKEDLMSHARVLQDQLQHCDLYILQKENIRYGLDQKNLYSCCTMAEIEQQTINYKPVISAELIRRFGRALHDINDDKMRACFIIATEVANGNPYSTPHLRNEAIIAQALIALKDYDQAGAVIDHVLDVYPFDDFCLYCKAEVLIEKPVSMWGFFGDSKENHLAQAQEILRALMPSAQADEADGVPMYQSKHDLVWAKLRLLEAKCQKSSSVGYKKSVQKSHELLKYIPEDSVYYGQAKRMIAQCLQMCPGLSTSYLNGLYSSVSIGG